MRLQEAIKRGAMLDIARAYLSFDLSVIPVHADGSKRPTIKWAEYMERKPTEDELQEWFAPRKAVGIAVVCGKVSGNLAVMDFESNSVWLRWRERAEQLGILEFFDGFPLVKTPKGGRHLYCRIVEQPAPGGKLAMRSEKETLVEVRGQGNYVLAPGCPSACHELNIPYVFEKMGWISGN